MCSALFNPCVHGYRSSGHLYPTLGGLAQAYTYAPRIYSMTPNRMRNNQSLTFLWFKFVISLNFFSDFDKQETIQVRFHWVKSLEILLVCNPSNTPRIRTRASSASSAHYFKRWGRRPARPRINDCQCYVKHPSNGPWSRKRKKEILRGGQGDRGTRAWSSPTRGGQGSGSYLFPTVVSSRFFLTELPLGRFLFNIQYIYVEIMYF